MTNHIKKWLIFQSKKITLVSKRMNWITQTTQWYFFLLLLGLVAFPVTKRIFGSFFDAGYSFSKTVGLLIISYATLVLGIYHIFPFSRGGLLLLIGLLGLGGAYLLRKQDKKALVLPRNPLILIIFQEILFIACLFFWAAVRGQEPSVHGLEKFMDFGFMNSILRSDYFPPKDMWLAGHSINYYYFGHLTGAVLTKLSGIASNSAYNLILATLFAMGVTQSFSLCCNLVYRALGKNIKVSFLAGILGAFLVNLSGNLHSIYAFTTGYSGDAVVPFWKILSSFNPTKYWYPNATRFIPFTIHEFPIYSYVVADLHGHVFDIPFVLLTLAFLFTVILAKKDLSNSRLTTYYSLLTTIILSFLCAIHYMTNAFDGPIYLLIGMAVLLYLYGPTKRLLVHIVVVGVGFIVFTFPFSSNFTPFVSGIGVNCAPAQLVAYGKIGPFLFEKGNCQMSSVWMLLVLWGFFLFHFAFFVLNLLVASRKKSLKIAFEESRADHFMLILFTIGTMLLIIPEYFYIKDIYPAHFRANTMFKLGYQAFIMMSIASTYTFFRLKKGIRQRNIVSWLYLVLFIPLFVLVAIYPTFAVNSYYGTVQKKPELNGTLWVHSSYPSYEGIITYLNKHVEGQPTILEAQGDSYTDFNLVSAYTGLPTVAGWWVHEWLWRGNSDVIGKLIPDIQGIYEGTDVTTMSSLIKKFNIKYMIVGANERSKYTKLNETVLQQLGDIVYSVADPTTASASYVLKIR